MDRSYPNQLAIAEPAQPPGRDFASNESIDISIVSLWRVLLRRREIVLCVVVLALCVGVFLATRPRKFVATGSLQVRSGSANQFHMQASEALGGGGDDRIESEVSILQSKSLYTKIAEQMNLASEPAIMGKAAKKHGSMQDPMVQDAVITTLRNMIHVERAPKTQIISVECTSTSPLLASQIVNTLMNQYIERIFETRFGSTQRASKFLTGQMDDLKNQVLKDQQQLIDLQGKLGVIGFDETHNLVTAQLEELAKASQQANIERITAEARYRILQDQSPDLIEGGPQMLSSGSNQSTTGALLQTLRGTRAQIAAEYANVTEQFGPNYPEAKRLKAQLAEATKQVSAEQERVMQEAKIAYDAAERNQRMTNEALTREKDKALGQRNDMVSYQLLLHDYQSSRTLYEGLMQRLREAGVVSGLESGDIELVDLAGVPVRPTGNGPIELIGISLVLGFVLACILALLAESMDTAVHSADDLERYINLPVLAVLPIFENVLNKRAITQSAGANLPTRPEDNRRADGNLEALIAPQSHFTEGIRLLRSSILLARADRRPKTIVFTSSVPQEGKSTVCSNEACILAQNGSRVLLIDADLRRPSQHVKFGIANGLGLSSVLTGNSTLESAVQSVDAVPSLHILTCGPLPPSPGELLGSDSMRQLLDQACQQYDFVLLDAPPSLSISDAAILAGLVDIVLLVVRDGVANKKMVRRTRNTLTRLHANMPGFIFNGVSAKSSEYYEYKGFYGYK